MDRLFTEVPLLKPNLLQRLLRRKPKRNAIIELTNLFATKPIGEIALADINQIAGKYKVGLSHRFRGDLQQLYATYFQHCLADRSLSEEEVHHLKHLKQLLGLTDKSVAVIHDKVSSEVYRSSIAQSLIDGEISEKEATFLKKLQEELQLPDELAIKIFNETKTVFFDDFIKKVSEDDRLTPAEEHELQQISSNLGLPMDDRTKTQLQRLKLYWLIENDRIPTIAVDLNLQRGEECYFITDVQWHEQRTVTKRVNYHSPTARIKIAKGIYYRIGSIAPQRVTTEDWKLIDSGRLFLTNKRLIFIGSKKNTTIRLDKILSFTPYSNGIGIEKDAGRSPLIIFGTNVDIAAMILSRLLN